MTTKFLVWADKNCNGNNIQWKQISGFEFFRLIKEPKNKARFFIKLPAEDYDDDEIYIESTESQYKEWKKEADHKRYLREQNEKFKTVSQYSYSSEEDEDIDIIENVSDGGQCVAEFVEDMILSCQLHQALNSLSEREFKIISLFSEGKTMRCIATELGMSKGAVQYQITIILEKLKKFLVQN